MNTGMDKKTEWVVGNAVREDYSEYSVGVSSDPKYYGDVDAQQADVIAGNLAALIVAEFPGITVTRDESPVRGPNRGTIEEIQSWIENNWTASL